MQKSLNILIVDDHPGASAVAAQVMTRAGHQVTVAENGAVALQLIHDEGMHFDAVILEADIPVMGGIEAARGLREHETTANIPIVGYSALLTITNADMNLEKGCRSGELLRALEMALSDRGAHTFKPIRPQSSFLPHRERTLLNDPVERHTPKRLR